MRPGTGTGAAAHAHDVIRDEDAAPGSMIPCWSSLETVSLSPGGGAVVVQDRHTEAGCP